MATLKQRTGYRFPSEIDDLLNRAASEGMDSQAQETLITQLAAHDQATTAFYRRVFMGVALLGLLYFVLVLAVVPHPGGADVGASPGFYGLAVASLLVSFATAWAIPPVAGAGGAVAGGRKARVAGPLEELVRWVPLLAPYEGLVRKGLGYLVVVNAALCAVICVIVARGEALESKSAVSIRFSAIPVLLVSIVVSIAKHELQPIDIQSLEQLKYDYKGA